MTVGISEVEINGNTYALQGPLIEGVIEEFPPNDRQQGQARLIDRRGKSAWLVRGVLGIGDFYTTEVNPTIRAQSSLAETRFGEVTHLPLVQNSTGPTLTTTYASGGTPTSPRVKFLHFASDLGFLYTDNADSDLSISLFGGGTDTWTSPAPVYTTGVNGFTGAAHVLGSSLIAYVGVNTNLEVRKSTAWGSGWAAVTGTVVTWDSATADTVRAITWDASTSVFGLHDASTNTLTIYKNTDAWATNGTTTLATISASHFNALDIFYDLSGNLRVVAGTDDAVWAIDVSTANNQTKLVELQSDANNCVGMTVWNGSLIVPLGSGGVEGRTWNGGSMASFRLLKGRFPAGWEGYVTATYPTDEFLFVAYGGNATGDTAHIFAVDTDFNWHVIAAHDTTNEPIDHLIVSGENDDQSRLHIISRESTTALDFFHIDSPLDNPRHVSIPCATSSKLILPEFVGEFPHVDKCFIQLLVDAEGLSATTAGEYINVDYGLDDNTVDTDLGNFLSGDKDLVFGSGAGVSGRSITIQVDQIRDAGTNTDRSYIRSLILEYLIVPDRLETYEMVVDCAETAKRRGGLSQVKDIVDELSTIQGSKTMVTLSFEGRSQVRVLPEPIATTQYELTQRFEIQGYNTSTYRLIKLVELL